MHYYFIIAVARVRIHVTHACMHAVSSGGARGQSSREGSGSRNTCSLIILVFRIERMARRLAILENGLFALHDSPASLCASINDKRDSTTWSMHALLSSCYYISKAAIYELRGNCELSVWNTYRSSFQWTMHEYTVSN